jgi:signal peptidase I
MVKEYLVVNTTKQSMPNADFARLMEAVLDKGKRFRFQASGHSMSPFIHSGDTITVEPITKGIHEGDVVAYTNPDNYRLGVHRVVQKVNGKYLIKGDHSPEADGLFTADDILGRVVSVEHHGKKQKVGLGGERILIAFFSRYGCLLPLLHFISLLIRPFRRANL